MSNSIVIRNQLINEWKRIVQQWRTTCGHWNDPKRYQFEKEIWREFENTVPRFLDKLGEVNQTIEKSLREIDNLITK